MENPFSILERRLNRTEELLEEILKKLKLLDKPHQTDEWLSLEQLAEYLPDKPALSTLYAKLSKGELPGRKTSKKWRFLKSEIDTFLNQGKHFSQTEIDAAADNSLIKK